MSQHIDTMPSRSEVSALNSNSVSKKTEIPANSNANNYTENGIYTIGAGNSSTVSNLATTGASELVVFTSTAYTVQTQYLLGDGSTPIQLYQRYFRNNIWSAWEQLALKSDTSIFLGTQTFANAKAMCNYFKGLAGTSFYLNKPLYVKVIISQPGDSDLFGTSSFLALAEFSSVNYGNILCMSDNKISGGIKNVCIAVANAYIESFTPTEVTISL